MTRKAAHVEQMAKKLLCEVVINCQCVIRARIRSFYGLCVSLSLVFSWARYNTRSLYWDLSRTLRKSKCGLTHISLRNIGLWKKLSALREIKQGRSVRPTAPEALLHTDAADFGCGATLNVNDLSAGAPGMSSHQKVWTWRQRAEPITLRELKPVLFALSGHLGQQLRQNATRQLLVYVDNTAVVHICSSLPWSSRAMLRELRQLNSVLDRMGFVIRAEWLLTVLNWYADGLSRRFHRGDLQTFR